MSVYDQIKTLCNERNMSMLKMENAIGISPGSSSKWKKSAPSADALVKLAKYFEVKTDYLLGLQEEPMTDYILEDDRLNRIIAIYEDMNDAGRDALLSTAEGLGLSGRFKKERNRSEAI